jgi:ABC-type transport system substrate-binding protein
MGRKTADMESTNYWTRLTSHRARRRNVLAFGVGAAALAIAGCGGGSEGEKTSKSSLIYEPVDTSAKAMPGGILSIAQGEDVQTFDTLTNFSTDSAAANRVYSRLVKWETFKREQGVQPSTVGDAASSWEVSPDGMQVTYKVRPNLKLDSRAPTNGRAVTAADFKFSFDRYAARGVNRTVLFNAASPEGPIASTEAPDNQTFVVKLSFPYAPLNSLLTFPRNIVVIPKEADGGFDVRSEARGSGAWRIKEVVRSARYEYVKNPDWYDANKSKLEGILSTVIKDAATGVAQLASGNLWTYNVPADQVIQTKQAAPNLLMTRDEQFVWHHDDVRFSYLPGSPFRDERVRKALSLLIDRDLFIETFGNVQGYKSQGIDVASRWNTAIACSEDGFWLDPQSKEFGDNARFYRFDPGEAKKLMLAAGHNGPLESKYTYSVGRGDTVYERKSEVLGGMWQEGGLFKLKVNPVDHQNDFTPNYYQNQNRFEGIINHTLGSQPEVDSLLYYLYKSEIPRSGHLDANGQPDTVLDEMLSRQRREPDLQRRIAIVKDIQRYAAGKMYVLHEPGSSIGFSLAWNWVGNWGAYRSKAGSQLSEEVLPNLWYDQTKKA